MPEIDLHDEDIFFDDQYNSIWLILTYSKLCAFAFFPNDQSARMDYIRHFFGRFSLRIKNESNFKNYEIKSKFSHYCNSIGGEFNILEASNTVSIQEKLKKVYHDGRIFGMTFSAIYSLTNTSNLDTLASKNKMAYFAEKQNYCTRSKFFNILEQFKNVGHIWGAIYVESLMYGSPNAPNEQPGYAINDIAEITDVFLRHHDFEDFCRTRLGQMILNILAWSIEFQKFGTTYGPIRSPRPVMQSSTVWMVPEYFESNLGPLPKLKPEVIDTLQKYRAPKDLGG